MKTLVIKEPGDCPFCNSVTGECDYAACGLCCDDYECIPPDCPLREGLTITVEEE